MRNETFKEIKHINIPKIYRSTFRWKHRPQQVMIRTPRSEISILPNTPKTQLSILPETPQTPSTNSHVIPESYPQLVPMGAHEIDMSSPKSFEIPSSKES